MVRDEHEQLRLLLNGWAEKAARSWQAVPGRFIAVQDRTMARSAARENGVEVFFNGGYEGAEREQVCFAPQDLQAEFSFVWLQISWNVRFNHVSHSDLLGSLMALGVDRSRFGDLVQQEDQAWLCTMPETAAQLPNLWDKAGNAPIRVRLCDESPVIEPPKGAELRDTVPSLRLDCIVSSGTRQSRTKAAELIRAGLVSVDHQPELRCDRLLQPGQLLSVRHFGRIRLLSVGEATRKDRLPVTLEIFTRNK